MGSEACADEVMNEEVMRGSWKLICKVGDDEEEAKNVAGPATPEENGEHNRLSSPPPSSPNATTSLETPKDTLYDSFAPASDKLLLAPRHMKCREESPNHVVRRLNFTSLIRDFDFNNVEETSDEERLFEILCGTIMDAIFAEQAAATGEGTPKSTLLTGVADTCPAAPIKSATRQRCIDKEICKKLEF